MSSVLQAARGERLYNGGVPRLSPLEGEKGRDGWNFEEGDEIVPGLHAIRLLGGGSRYEAYLAWQDELHCLVVAKVLRPRSAASSGARDALGREAGILENLQHPSLLRCFGSVVDGPRPNLVLEFLEGPPLSTLVRKFGALAPEQLASLSLQICSVLHYLGTKRMLHLDVKPRNIIMGPVPRLIDLSIARSFGEGRALEHPVGTDAYMAPEQCEPAKAGVGPEADIWGLGVTLYEAATGTGPFPPSAEGAVEAERLWPQLSHDPAPLWEQVPVALAQLIRSCLERRPQNRPRPHELASSLETIVAGLPRRPVLGRLRPRLR